MPEKQKPTGPQAACELLINIKQIEILKTFAEFVVSNNERKGFIYHGTRHKEVVLAHALNSSQSIDQDLAPNNILVKLTALFHDFQVGDNFETSEIERDEVVSAKLLKDAIYEVTRSTNLSFEAKKILDQLIQQMQIAIISTTVNKKRALSKEIPN